MKYFAIVLASIAVLASVYQTYQLHSATKSVAFENRNWRKTYFCEGEMRYLHEIKQWFVDQELSRKKNCEYGRCKDNNGEVTDEKIIIEEIKFLSTRIEYGFTGFSSALFYLSKTEADAFPISPQDYQAALKATDAYIYLDGDYDAAIEAIRKIADKRDAVVDFCRQFHSRTL